LFDFSVELSNEDDSQHKGDKVFNRDIPPIAQSYRRNRVDMFSEDLDIEEPANKKTFSNTYDYKSIMSNKRQSKGDVRSERA